MNVEPTTPSPVKQRVEVIDAVRGFAVFGILLANIQSWSGYRFLPFTEVEHLPGYDLDAALYWVHKAFVDSKFYAIFSMLFGAGFWLQFRKHVDNQPPFLRIYRRRLALLLGFGALHSLLWSGDILMLYALLGFVLVELRNLKPWTLLCVAMALFAAFLVPNLCMLHAMPGYPQVDQIARSVFPDIHPGAYVEVFRSGAASDIFRLNVHNLGWRWYDFLPDGRVTRVTALFALGLFLARKNFFSDHAHRPGLILIFSVIGLLATWLGMSLGTASRWPESGAQVGGKAAVVVGQVTLALAYIGVLAVLFRGGVGRVVLHPLTLVGRMAFTHYLGQTVVGVLIFYSFGLGHYGTMGLAQIWVVALVIFAAQAITSSVWLRLFRFGPVEWAWRCLTYKKRFPIRREA